MVSRWGTTPSARATFRMVKGLAGREFCSSSTSVLRLMPARSASSCWVRACCKRRTRTRRPIGSLVSRMRAFYVARTSRVQYTSSVTNKERASSATTDPLVVNTWIGQVSTVTTLSAFPATDPRGAKAVAIAADAGQWAKITTRDGRKYYGIRASDGSHYYLVNRTSCTCFDAQRHECKHQLAVRLHCDHVQQ